MENQTPSPQPVNQTLNQTSTSVTPAIPEKPKSKFPKPMLIGIIVFVILAILGGLAFAFKDNISNLVAKPTPTPAPQSPTPTPDPTADWETFKTEAAEFKIPGNSTYKTESNGSTQNFYTFDINGSTIIYEELINNEGVLPYFRDTDNTQTINAIDWKVDLNRELFGDADESSLTKMSYYIVKNDKIHSFYFDSEDLQNLIEQILSTFKFIESTTSETEAAPATNSAE